MSNIIFLVIILSIWFISSVVKKANKALRMQELERMKRIEEMDRQSGRPENGHFYDNAYSYEEKPFSYDDAAVKERSVPVTKAKPDKVITSNELPQQSHNAAIKIAGREFDLDTAVIFSEILRPKYQDY